MPEESGDPREVARRPILKAAVTGAAVVGGLGAAARLGWLSGAPEAGGPGGGRPLLQLSANQGGIRTLELPLGDDLLPRVAPGLWRSTHLTTSTHSMVACTRARGGSIPHVEVRALFGGSWQPWRWLPFQADKPDADEEKGVAGTQLAWIGRSNGIQLRVSGARPADLTLVLVEPDRRLGDRAPASGFGVRGRVAASGASAVPAPALLGRRDWAADESWRNGDPRYNNTIEQAHVHHTANSNDYGVDDVPVLMRGMYWYHTHSLGWSDIAYNFVVDRFGRAWVGRAGGVNRPVRGAHTLGFNATSTGIAVLGNFEVAEPPPEVLTTVASIAAWKLARYGRDPLGLVEVASEGSDKFKPRQVVQLPVVDGHRDTNDTTCPGEHLYANLQGIRQAAKDLIVAYTGPVTITTPFALSGTLQVGNTLMVAAGAFTPADAVARYTWIAEETPIPGATAQTYTVAPADIGRRLAVRVDVEKPNITPATQTLDAGLLTTAPQVVVRAHGKSRRAVVRVRVTGADYAGVATGEVVIRFGERKKVLALVNGECTARFLQVPPGRYTAFTRYRGDGVVERGEGRNGFWVRS